MARIPKSQPMGDDVANNLANPGRMDGKWLKLSPPIA
jgi:hypothetical protein